MMRSVGIGMALLVAGCGDASREPDQPEAAASSPTSQRVATVPTPAPASVTAAATSDGLQIVGTENQYDIVLPTDILFDFDRAELRPEAEPMLGKVKAHLDANGADQLHVKGHTDAKGDDQYNFRLSMRRAAAVCDWLKARGQRLTNCIGRGEQEPVAPNAAPDGTDDPAGRQQNRRVAISVIKYPDVNAMMEEAKRQAREGTAGLRKP